jgi:cellulose synthase/poly-beta-1,6-N-acetylglucosamine synthase-like glycosyltransferase
MAIPETIVLLFLGLKVSLIFSISYRLRLRTIPSYYRRRDSLVVLRPAPVDSLPYVCVQLPLFNEPGQIKDLLASVCGFDWPAEKLAIQILDDSDFEPYLQESREQLAHYRKLFPQLKIDLINRVNRTGYKAGALNHGMALCGEAEYFAIFDCDFRPSQIFLRRAISEFSGEPAVAAVQAAWSFRNGDESYLTRLQQTMLGLHFHVDHFGRQARRWVLNFNGTAGVWSAAALRQLGGWSDASVTEDLLLSFRAELSGMRVRYVDSLSCSSELPRTLSSFLVQQRRWAKGHGQVLRIVWASVLRYRGWVFFKKMDALLHLWSYAHSAVLMLMIILLPWWVQGRARWVAATPATDLFRVLEAAVWIVLVIVFARLYSLQTATNAAAKDDSVGKPYGIRLWSRPLLVAAAAPYFSCLILPSFVAGFVSRSKQSRVFERTPKGNLEGVQRRTVRLRECSLILGVWIFLVAMAFRAAGENMWISCGVLVFQSVAAPFWMLRRWFQLAELMDSLRMGLGEILRNGIRGAMLALIGIALLHEVSWAAEKFGLASAGGGASGEPEFVTEQFKSNWYDGQAELSSYFLEIERYGERRLGSAVIIFVTEPFSLSRRVKSDSDKGSKGDALNVMKSNVMMDFPTGIYDYNTMISTFVSLDKGGDLPAGSLLKSSFSSQEWCGHVYEQFMPFGRKLKIQSHSYFEGEADQDTELSIPADATYAEGLYHWARGMSAPYLKSGGRAVGSLLDSSFDARLSHFQQGFEQADFSVAERAEPIKLSADGGSAEVRQAIQRKVTTKSGRTFTFWVASEFPFAILKWQVTGGRGPSISASLNKTTRNSYWKLNNNASVGRLQDLGMVPRGRNMP